MLEFSLIKALAVWDFLLSRTRVWSAVEGWAADNLYHLLESQRRIVRYGPLFWTSSQVPL